MLLSNGRCAGLGHPRPLIGHSYVVSKSNPTPLQLDEDAPSREFPAFNTSPAGNITDWLALPELSQEFYRLTFSSGSGNWGLLDQFAALPPNGVI